MDGDERRRRELANDNNSNKQEKSRRGIERRLIVIADSLAWAVPKILYRNLRIEKPAIKVRRTTNWPRGRQLKPYKYDYTQI